MLKVNNIYKTYGNNTILKQVTFEAHAGEIIGLVAPNGTGKSTILNIIMNFTSPDSGIVSILDKFDYSTKSMEIKMHQYLSSLPELNDLYEELNGYEHLKLYAKIWKTDLKYIEEIINDLKMHNYVKKPVRTYSLGMRQRLAFAMLLAADTDIMLMDEVMNGLDPDNVAIITDILIRLKTQGKIILIASHLLDNLDLYTDRILFFRDGNIILETKDFDKDKINKTFIKVNLTKQDYLRLNDITKFPDSSNYIGNRVLAIPIKNLSRQDISEWIHFFLDQNIFNVTIGQIGTSEWYEEFYNKFD